MCVGKVGKGLLYSSVAVFLARVLSLSLGRYEITEIPLPSSVIEQINKNNVQATPNPGQVTPSGVPIETAVTRIVQLPQPGKCFCTCCANALNRPFPSSFFLFFIIKLTSELFTHKFIFMPLLGKKMSIW